MGVGVLGLTMEPAAKHVEEAARPEPGETINSCKLVLAYPAHPCLSGLARVRHLPVEGQTVLEALLRPPVATTSVVVISSSNLLGSFGLVRVIPRLIN